MVGLTYKGKQDEDNEDDDDEETVVRVQNGEENDEEFMFFKKDEKHKFKKDKLLNDSENKEKYLQTFGNNESVQDDESSR